MKKSLLALAVLGAFAGVASAQSSVTLFGIVDVNARYIKNDGSSRRVSLSQDGINSSRLGFRGTEDLGGGLKAGFWIEGGLNPDTGGSGQSWTRRSTLSLMGGFGEIRLGRDYTPTFVVGSGFDVFGTNGLGDSSTVKQLAASDFVRASNSIGYFLPGNIGGLYGQFMVAAGEGLAPGRYVGGKIGFAAGPFDVAGAYSQETLAAGKYKTAVVGGSYDLGVVKLLGYYNQEKLNTAKDSLVAVSLSVPLGQGEIRAGYQNDKLTNVGVSNKISKLGLGYVYNLSKRTAMYSTVARVSNGSSAPTNSVVGSPAVLTALGAPAPGSQVAYPTSGKKSTGLEVGIRHIF